MAIITGTLIVAGVTIGAAATVSAFSYITFQIGRAVGQTVTQSVKETKNEVTEAIKPVVAHVIQKTNSVERSVGAVANRTGQHLDSTATIVKSLTCAAFGLAGLGSTAAMQSYLCEKDSNSSCDMLAETGMWSSAIFLGLSFMVAGHSLVTSTRNQKGI